MILSSYDLDKDGVEKVVLGQIKALLERARPLSPYCSLEITIRAREVR